MEMRKPMTATEKRLFKEAIIKEYKLKNESKQKNSLLNTSIRRLKRIAPLYLIVGIAASITLIWYEGWRAFVNTFLGAVIFITLVSTTLSAFLKVK